MGSRWPSVNCTPEWDACLTQLRLTRQLMWQRRNIPAGTSSDFTTIKVVLVKQEAEKKNSAKNSKRALQMAVPQRPLFIYALIPFRRLPHTAQTA